MSSIYDVDFDNQADEINNPRFRFPDISAFLHVLVKPVQWLRDAFFSDFLNGTNYTAWSSLTAYNKGDRVTFGRASYECYVANTNQLPTAPESGYWFLICQDNIGIEERKKYTAQKLQLEYILNRRFSPSTITPPFGIGTIYIITYASKPRVLYSSTQDKTSGYTFPRTATAFYFCPKGNPSGGAWALPNFIIYVPSAVLAAIDSDVASAKKVIMAETAKYSIGGMTYRVDSY